MSARSHLYIRLPAAERDELLRRSIEARRSPEVMAHHILVAALRGTTPNVSIRPTGATSSALYAD